MLDDIPTGTVVQSYARAPVLSDTNRKINNVFSNLYPDKKRSDRKLFRMLDPRNELNLCNLEIIRKRSSCIREMETF